MTQLFCFGYGYTTAALGSALSDSGWQVAGTRRQTGAQAGEQAGGINLLTYDGGNDSGGLPAPVVQALSEASHLLFSIPPEETGDPALAALEAAGVELPSLQWAGYLSTTGVYGDTGGAWVDESSPTAPVSTRSRNRVKAEIQFRDWAMARGIPGFIFRLAGIYGPGRTPFRQLRNGDARRIYKPGQVFSRIHLADIVQALTAAIANPAAAGTYNLCDNEPARPWEVIGFAADLAGIEPPPMVPFHQAELSPMAQSFYSECRRVDNARLRTELGVTLIYPSYRDGLAAEFERL